MPLASAKTTVLKNSLNEKLPLLPFFRNRDPLPIFMPTSPEEFGELAGIFNVKSRELRRLRSMYPVQMSGHGGARRFGQDAKLAAGSSAARGARNGARQSI